MMSRLLAPIPLFPEPFALPTRVTFFVRTTCTHPSPQPAACLLSVQQYNKENAKFLIFVESTPLPHEFNLFPGMFSSVNADCCHGRVVMNALPRFPCALINAPGR